MKHGILYGVGVGPGDPELLTLKAARLLMTCDCIAIPHRSAEQCFAYRIACGAVQEAADRPVLCIDMPMTRDQQARERACRAGADALCAALADGKTVVFVTLGDPSVYSTFAYLAARVEAQGFAIEWVPGVPSFCAAASALKEPLCTDREPLHILPGGVNAEDALRLSGTRVFMKGELAPLLEALRDADVEAKAVENCGTAEQRVYRSAAEIPADAGYYLVTIVKEERQ